MDMLALQAALGALGPIAVPTQYRTVAQLAAQTRVLLDRHSNLLDHRIIGTSRAGAPIEMISIGTGPKSALLIGAPHPNEPVGCVTIEVLLQQLCNQPDLLAALPYRWHVVPAIEPDALRLNEGWFDQPGDIGHFLRHYFRPAFIDQAEYGFPFAAPVAHAVPATPENDAYREAFRIAQPNLVCPLHNATFGGCFYLLSRDMPELAAELSGQPQRLGLRTNLIGEATGHDTTYASGVFASLDVAALRPPRGTGPGWTAGDSASSFAERQGALSLIPEVSPWDSAPAGEDLPSGATRAQVHAAWRDWRDALATIGQTVLEKSARPTSVPDGLIWRSVAELTANASWRGTEAATDETPLSVKEYQVTFLGMRLVNLRGVSLIRRLAALQNNCAGEVARCDDYIAQAMTSVRRDFAFSAVPLERLVMAQIQAVFAGAAALMP